MLLLLLLVVANSVPLFLDMAIYGEEPALDSLSLVVCGDCGRVVKSQALVNHKGEQYTCVITMEMGSTSMELS